MARQSQTPLDFETTVRPENGILQSSGFAGRVTPAGYFPLLPGDSASGKFAIDIKLAEMPRPLDVAVFANVQAWCVPKNAHPQFTSETDIRHAFVGGAIKALGSADRTPPPFFIELAGASLTTAAGSEFFKTLGIHIPAGETINSDLLDAFWLVYNFRLAAHSSRLAPKPFASQDIAAATTLPPAFWPSTKRAHMVPDYDRSLILGNLDLDVLSGKLPVMGVYRNTVVSPSIVSHAVLTSKKTTQEARGYVANTTNSTIIGVTADNYPEIYAEMTGQKVGITLADIDMARTTQAFARAHAAYAGNKTHAFDNKDAVVAMLMRGVPVADQDMKRPWLLDAQRVPVGWMERHATDAANLDDSVTTGRAQAMLSLNVPMLPYGGTVIFTVEILPERLDERQTDEWLCITNPSELPNPLRDVQRVEPVDMVTNRRIDAKHASPNAAYGWEPMNAKWQREFTRLGGVYYQPDPAAPFSEQRVAIWQHEIVNPSFTAHHYLAPYPFPQDPFSVPTAPCFHFVARHVVAVSGQTQIGDVLSENNDDYAEIVVQQVP